MHSCVNGLLVSTKTESVDALAKIATTATSNVDNARIAGKKAEKTFLENIRKASLRFMDSTDVPTSSSPSLTQSFSNAGDNLTASTDITKDSKQKLFRGRL